MFQRFSQNICLNIPLKTNLDIENAVRDLSTVVQQAAWNATPDRSQSTARAMIGQNVKSQNSREAAVEKEMVPNPPPKGQSCLQ